MRGVSPIVAFVILVVLIFSIATFVVPWALNLARETAIQTQNRTEGMLECQDAAYSFDPEWGVHGIKWDFGVNDTLEAKIVNSGLVSLWGFSFEIEIEQDGEISIKHFGSSGFTQDRPLKPGESGIIRANLTEDVNGTLKSVKVLNSRCPQVWISQSI